MNNSKKIIIAIDGFSSCGKSTMAKDLAKEIGYIYIDSGAMYSAVTLFCIRSIWFLELRVKQYIIKILANRCYRFPYHNNLPK